MVLRRFTDFILKSRLQAMGTAFVCAFIPLVGSVSILISAFVTLRKNSLDGFYILIAATLPLFIALYGYSADTVEGFSNFDIVLLMAICNVLTWAFAVLLRKYGSWNLLLQLAAFICLVIVLAVHMLYPDIQAYWQTHLTSYLSSTMQSVSGATGDEAPEKIGALGSMVQTLSPLLTGIVSTFVVFYALVQLLLARWWQAALYNRGGLRVELDNIRLSYAAGIIFIICFMFVVAGNPTAEDAGTILYVTFALAGFSVLHALIASSKKAWLWNGLMCLLIFVIPPSMFVIALIALLDTGIDLRKRLVKKINVS
jgi:hypothetical protein